MRNVTLADVSRSVGLGIATVSRALAVPPHSDVSESTRTRVREAADRLGYRPSRTARALRVGDYHALSAVVPDDAWGWWEPAVHAAFEEAMKAGYQILVHPVSRSSGAAAVIESLSNVPTEGVLLFGTASNKEAKERVEHLRLPAVAIDDSTELTYLPTFSADNELGAYIATKYLIDKGRRSIVYLGHTPDVAFAANRERGYRRALEDSGISVCQNMVVRSPDGIDESLEELSEMKAFLSSGQEFDAVLCEYDLLAAPLLRSLAVRGLTVPADVAVVGYDDERAAQLLQPQLTTIRQPYEQLGSAAVRTLLRAINGGFVPDERVLFNPKLIERGSA